MNANSFIEKIQFDMRSAMKARDLAKVKVLKNLLARISSAEAVKMPNKNADANSRIAGVATGVGSTEVARHDLTLSELKALVNEEIGELQKVIGQLESGEYRDDLVDQVAILDKYAG